VPPWVDEADLVNPFSKDRPLQSPDDPDDPDGEAAGTISYFDLQASDTWETDLVVTISSDAEAKAMLDDGNPGRYPKMKISGYGEHVDLLRAICVPELRPASHVLQSEIGSLYNGLSFMNRQFGLTMNAHITLDLSMIGITNHDDCSKILSKFNHETGKWLKVRDCAHLYAYVHEGSRLQGQGIHTHILTYLPERYAKEFQA
jgi:hypothetical protein